MPHPHPRSTRLIHIPPPPPTPRQRLASKKIYTLVHPPSTLLLPITPSAACALIRRGLAPLEQLYTLEPKKLEMLVACVGLVNEKLGLGQGAKGEGEGEGEVRFEQGHAGYGGMVKILEEDYESEWRIEGWTKAGDEKVVVVLLARMTATRDAEESGKWRDVERDCMWEVERRRGDMRERRRGWGRVGGRVRARSLVYSSYSSESASEAEVVDGENENEKENDGKKEINEEEEDGEVVAREEVDGEK